MRRAVIPWAVAFLVIVGAFAGTVAALNSSIYSAHGFVQGYLDALARQDSTAALATAGVVAGDGDDPALLVDAAMSEVTDIRLISDTAQSGGTHRVTFVSSVDGEKATSVFVVRAIGTRLGLFTTWEFATSPLSTIDLTVRHSTTFTANGVVASSNSDPGQQAPFAVFAPGLYSLDHESTWLEATAVRVPVASAGATVTASIETVANKRFVDELQQTVDAHLDDCVTQTVLMPTGCPFGKQIANRIDGAPAWSMSRYPAVTIVAGAVEGTWEVPRTIAAAHLTVGIRSLFDGTRTEFDDDVPFDVQYVISINADDSLRTTAVYQ